MMKQNLATDRRNSYKTFAKIWIIAWGGSTLDAISTIFGVMRLGNIERNPIIHLLIDKYGLGGIMVYLPIEATVYAAIPLLLFAVIARSKIKFDRFERTTIALAAGMSLSFPYLVAIGNLLFVIRTLAA